MRSSPLPGPLPLGDGSKPFGCCALSLTEMLCGIRVLSPPSGPGSHCQSVSLSVKGTRSCLHGLGKQAYLGVSVRDQRQLPGPHLILGQAHCALSGQGLEGLWVPQETVSSHVRVTCCLVLHQCLVNARLMESTLFNLPLIEVGEEQAKESIKEWSHHSSRQSWLHKKGEKNTSRVDEFLVSTRPFISHVIFHC